MTDTNEAGLAGGEGVAVHKYSGDGPLTAREAANSIVDWQRKRAADPGKAESAPAATPEPVKESVTETDAAPQEIEAPGETQEAEPAESPPIEPPRSWTKAEQEEFASYPREAQEKIARREQERESAVRRSQNEASELKKGLSVKEQAVEQARQQYESALPIILNELQAVMAGEFSDIRTMDDVQKLANEDWPRYVRWDAQQKRLAAVQQQVTTAHERQTHERKAKFADFAKAETEKLYERFPELRDDDKRTKITASVISTLKEVGFSDDELGSLMEKEWVYDHRVRELFIDATKYREAQKQTAKVVAKALPPVQKPGVSKSAPDNTEQVRSLEKQLKTATGMKAQRLAGQLIQLKAGAGR